MFSCGCITVALVSTALFLMIFIAVIGAVFVMAASGGLSTSFEGLPTARVNTKFTEEHVSGPFFSRNKVIIIDIKGVIVSGESSYYDVADSELICEQIKAAADDPSVKAVVLNLNTPGGEVTASDEIYNEVMNLRKEGKKVVASMSSMAASGGYYIAAGADRIIANKHTLTGSIGVIMSTYNYTELFSKIGLKSEVFKSGQMKDMLNGGRPRTEVEVSVVQNLIDSTYSEFVNIVAKGRGIPAETVKGTIIGDGRVFDGKQALALKLIDKIGYLDDSIEDAAKLAGLQKHSYSVVRYEEAFSFARLFSQVKSGIPSKSMNISIQGNPGRFQPQCGKLYFLPPEL